MGIHQKHIILSYLNFLDFQNVDIFVDLSAPIFFVSYFSSSPKKDVKFLACLEEFCMEYFLTTHYFDKLQIIDKS